VKPFFVGKREAGKNNQEHSSRSLGSERDVEKWVEEFRSFRENVTFAISLLSERVDDLERRVERLEARLGT